MDINFYASLRKITGERTVNFDIPPGSTIRQMLALVLTLYPEMKDSLLDQDDTLDRHAHVFVNGRDVPHLKMGITTVLTDADKVDIFPVGHF